MLPHPFPTTKELPLHFVLESAYRIPGFVSRDAAPVNACFVNDLIRSLSRSQQSHREESIGNNLKLFANVKPCCWAVGILDFRYLRECCDFCT